MTLECTTEPSLPNPDPRCAAAQATINEYKGSCDTITVAGSKVGISKGTLAGAIIGAIFGVLILVALIGTLVWCCCCQIRR